MPFAETDLAVVAAAHRAGGAALLLRAVNPIRKAVVGRDVINLRGRLVVPGAPGCAAVHADYRALITRQRDDLRIFRADPDALVIIAARRPLEAGERFPAVGRAPRRRVRHVHNVWIVWRHGNPHRARPAPANPPVVVHALPGFPAVLRAIHARVLLRFDGGIDAARPAARHGDANSAQAVGARRQAFRQLAPRVAAIRGFVEPASRRVDHFAVARREDERLAAANLPRRNPRRPEIGINDLWIRRIEDQISRAGVFVLVENLLPTQPAVGRTKNAALRIRAIRMSDGRDKNAIRVARIDQNGRNLLRVAQAKMSPRLPAVGGFVNPLADRKIRPLKTLTAPHINHVRIRRRYGNGSNRARRLIIKKRRPRVAEVRRLPYPAVHRRHVKHICLLRHAGDRHRPPAPKRPNAPPPHLPKHLLLIFLPASGSSYRKSDHPREDPQDQVLRAHTKSRPSVQGAPPQSTRGYSASRDVAIRAGALSGLGQSASRTISTAGTPIL